MVKCICLNAAQFPVFFLYMFLCRVCNFLTIIIVEKSRLYAQLFLQHGKPYFYLLLQRDDSCLSIEGSNVQGVQAIMSKIQVSTNTFRKQHLISLLVVKSLSNETIASSTEYTRIIRRQILTIFVSQRADYTI